MSNRSLPAHVTMSIHLRPNEPTLHGPGLVGPFTFFADNTVWDEGAQKAVEMTKTDSRADVTPRAAY